MWALPGRFRTPGGLERMRPVGASFAMQQFGRAQGGAGEAGFRMLRMRRGSAGQVLDERAWQRMGAETRA